MSRRNRKNAPEREVTVTTSKGPLKGIINYSSNRTKYHSFKMIPYAHIPIGPLRFAPPVEIETWSENNVLEESRKMGFGKENLLLLNIYTPELKEPESTKTFDRPVIVFVPGDTGCITYNTLNYHGPQFLMNQDVVLVVVCYRAGMLGFLKFDDPELNAPGDVGYRDLKMAFGWIKKEIEIFGGSPNNITAYGQGYGANLIRHLLMDKNNENMFHKSILSSCLERKIKMDEVNSTSGVYIGPLVARKLFKTVGQRLQLDSNLMSEIDCCKLLRKVDYSLIEVAHSTYTSLHMVDFITKDQVQGHFDQKYPVKIPIMIGYNSQEALIEQFMLDENEELNIPIFYRYLVRNGACGVCLSEEQKKIVAETRNKFQAFETLHQFKELGVIPIDNMLNFCSDGMYNMGIISMTRTLASEMSPNKVYFYRFAAKLALKFSEDPKLPNLGVCHGYELPYIFKLPHINYPKENSPEDMTIKRMTMLWAQFARTGDPNPPELDEELITEKWPPVEKNLKFCFNFSETCVQYGVIPCTERMRYWEMRVGVQFLSSFIRQNKKQNKRQEKQDKRQDKEKSGKQVKGG